MSIQMNLIFISLVVEMSILTLLLLPLPHIVRLNMIHVHDILRANNNFKVGVAFSSILLTLQFLDCLKKSNRYSQSTLNEDYLDTYGNHHHQPISLTNEQLASKFYAQRNLYLTGAVLFCGLGIMTVVTIVKKLVLKESQFRELKKLSVSGDDGEAAKVQSKEIQSLKEQIRQKDIDIQVFKKQIKGLQIAYNDLSQKIETGFKTNKKKD